MRMSENLATETERTLLLSAGRVSRVTRSTSSCLTLLLSFPPLFRMRLRLQRFVGASDHARPLPGWSLCYLSPTAALPARDAPSPRCPVPPWLQLMQHPHRVSQFEGEPPLDGKHLGVYGLMALPPANGGKPTCAAQRCFCCVEALKLCSAASIGRTPITHQVLRTRSALRALPEHNPPLSGCGKGLRHAAFTNAASPPCCPAYPCMPACLKPTPSDQKDNTIANLILVELWGPQAGSACRSASQARNQMSMHHLGWRAQACYSI